MPSIIPSLWFDNDLEEAAEFYVSIFPNSRIEAFNRYSDAGPGEPGSVMSATFVLDGARFFAINGGPQFPFTEAVSFVVHCADQDEVDRHWSRLELPLRVRLDTYGQGREQVMAAPGWIDVQAPGVNLKALSWGPPDAPIALCLHGFPDTAYGWREFAPRLVESGWRVIAPFMRGYAPSSIPSDGSYHVGALMDDALRVRSAAGGTAHDVVIGHDWGAIAATGLAAMPDSPFAKAVIMSVPPAAVFNAPGGVRDRGRLLGQLPGQLRRSWYIFYFQLPWLPEHSASWVTPLLWRRWSPNYDAKEDLRHVDAAIGTPESWRAALGPYRATVRNTRPPKLYADLHRQWILPPQLPSLYLHGRDDGCVTPAFAHWTEKVLPPGSDVAIVENAGHFLQLDQPEKVAELVLKFIGSPG